MPKIAKTIIPHKVFPEKHELETAWFFNKLGEDVEFISRNYNKGMKTPDIKMSGIFWEIKAPKSDSKYTIQHSFKKALRQSQNIIFDLRRIKIAQDKCIDKLKKEFSNSKSIKRLLIITKSNNLLDFTK
jgi:hypothetical protein